MKIDDGEEKMNIQQYCWRIAEKTADASNLIVLIKTRVGLKNINMKYVSEPFKPHIIALKDFSSNSLYLGPDYLKNKYTLLGTPIIDSPHAKFIKALMNKEDICETEYVKRWKNGTLDWRRPLPLPKDYFFWEKKCNQGLLEVQNQKTRRIRVYEIAGVYYIYDGKHRAAMYSVLGLPIPCEVISCDCVLGYYGRFMFNSIKNNRNYSMHSDFEKRARMERQG